MRKFNSKGKMPFGILSLLCLVMIIIGAIWLGVGIDRIEVGISLLSVGIMLGMIAFAAFFATARDYLVIDDEKIIFPITRVPKLKFKRNAVLFSEIKCVKIEIYKGDGIVVLDSHMYTFTLKNGLRFTENFAAAYGKKQETEILQRLKEKVHFVF